MQMGHLDLKVSYFEYSTSTRTWSAVAEDHESRAHFYTRK